MGERKLTRENYLGLIDSGRTNSRLAIREKRINKLGYLASLKFEVYPYNIVLYYFTVRSGKKFYFFS